MFPNRSLRILLSSFHKGIQGNIRLASGATGPSPLPMPPCDYSPPEYQVCIFIPISILIDNQLIIPSHSSFKYSNLIVNTLCWVCGAGSVVRARGGCEEGAPEPGSETLLLEAPAGERSLQAVAVGPRGHQVPRPLCRSDNDGRRSLPPEGVEGDRRPSEQGHAHLHVLHALRRLRVLGEARCKDAWQPQGTLSFLILY